VEGVKTKPPAGLNASRRFSFRNYSQTFLGTQRDADKALIFAVFFQEHPRQSAEDPRPNVAS
jgi:hypothetical protein